MALLFKPREKKRPDFRMVLGREKQCKVQTERFRAFALRMGKCSDDYLKLRDYC